nr:RNA-directed DNA polymerase, eukaryota, reverse transcriptase zinc-binding domain protein [Tanacetum cinerariifolium]
MWVKWNSVLMAKDSGGLVSSLYALNSLMMKWVWRFYNQKTSLWVNVIKAIHGEDESIGKAKYAGVRTCWTTIVNEIRILSDQGMNVLEFMRLKLGNGDMASFWNDNWSGGGVLKDLYPRLYALENEQEQLDALMDLVSTINLVSMGDRWVWTLESLGEFSVVSFRKVIDKKRLLSVYSKTRWVKYVPIKVNVLAWKIKMDVLLTRLNISRQIARKISLWWNVNYEDVNSYDEWSTYMVSLRLAKKSKLMFEGLDVKPRLVGTSGSKNRFLILLFQVGLVKTYGKEVHGVMIWLLPSVKKCPQCNKLCSYKDVLPLSVSPLLKESSTRYFAFTKQGVNEFKINERRQWRDAHELCSNAKRRMLHVSHLLQITDNQHTELMSQ